MSRRLDAGAPNDLRGLTAALRRYLEHLGTRGYRPSGIATAERYIREFERDMAELNVLPAHVYPRATKEIPACFATGEAAGSAAALAVKQGIDPAALDAGALREHLLAAGAILDA